MAPAYAAEAGQFEALKYSLYNGSDWDRNTIIYAKKNKSKETLEFLKDWAVKAPTKYLAGGYEGTVWCKDKPYSDMYVEELLSM